MRLKTLNHEHRFLASGVAVIGLTCILGVGYMVHRFGGPGPSTIIHREKTSRPATRIGGPTRRLASAAGVGIRNGSSSG